MEFILPHIEQLYHGFTHTPLLWNSDAIFSLKQIQIPLPERLTFERHLDKRLRLGQLAEQFLFNQIESLNEFEILAENLQIQRNKHTLGELDALVQWKNEYFHLEIIYKFYLYDPTIGKTEIENWIGPNRKDSLIEKLNKLKDKQLPLFHSEECQSALKSLGFDTHDFQQMVLFKAQLFTPYEAKTNFEYLNQDCVYGIYLNNKQLDDFVNCEFFIPTKLEWFLVPHCEVEWLTYHKFLPIVNELLEHKKSPLIWIKKPDDSIVKCFLVWW